jgi:hypothetical protein
MPTTKIYFVHETLMSHWYNYLTIVVLTKQGILPISYWNPMEMHRATHV